MNGKKSMGRMQTNRKTGFSANVRSRNTERICHAIGDPKSSTADRAISDTTAPGKCPLSMMCLSTTNDTEGKRSCISIESKREETAKILVIDDDPIVCDVIRDVLEPAYEITVALNAQEATEIIQNNSLDLLIVDYHLPGCDGKQLYDWIVSNHPALRNHIVFSTGDIFDEGIRSFIESTGCPCLYKPFSNSNLRHMVSALLNS